MGWTGRTILAGVLAASIFTVSAPAEAGPWCFPVNSFLLSAGDTDLDAPTADPAEEANLWAALCTVVAESDESLAVRFAEDKRSVIVWSRSLEQHQIAQRLLAGFPSEVVQHVYFAGDPGPGSAGTFVLDPPQEPLGGSLRGDLNPLLSDLTYAPTPSAVQHRAPAYLAGGIVALGIFAGGLYWRPRIGVRAYGGLMALPVGAGVLLFSVISETLGAGYPGFGRLQLAGLIGGLLLLGAGAIALRGQSERFRAL